ncbi:MAG TPA: ArsA-related P-loop ATPase, partial [Thermoanaerobaculia bacterium]
MTPPKAGSFAGLARELTSAFDRLAARRILLFGGKGGVGKTTLASLAAMHLARSRKVILFSTDPASNLGDLFTGSSFFVLRSSRLDVSPHPGPGAGRTNLVVRTLDADALWKAFLDAHLDSFVELGDRGTYLDRDEIRSLFRLSIPGID